MDHKLELSYDPGLMKAIEGHCRKFFNEKRN